MTKKRMIVEVICGYQGISEGHMGPLKRLTQVFQSGVAFLSHGTCSRKCSGSSTLELKSESRHVKSCRSQSMHPGMPVINDEQVDMAKHRQASVA